MNNVYIIAEVGQNHDGSLGQAHAFVDAAKLTGVNAIKFQTHIAGSESTKAEPWRVKFSKQDNTRYEYWKRMEFTEEQWKGLRDHAKEEGLDFISSPFSFDAVELLTRIGVDTWKVASGEVNNVPLFNKMLESKLPFLVSTGMSSYREIQDIVELLEKNNADYTIMQCTSMYPTPADKVGLNVLSEYRKRFNCKVGLSDHSGTIYPGIAAAALGIDVLEVHFTLSEHMFGPDIPVSLDVEEMKRMVEGVRYISSVMSHPVDKDTMAEELKGMRKLFNKSIVAKEAIPKNAVITEDLLAFKKPGNGLPPGEIDKLIGKTTLKDLMPDDPITLEDIK